MHTSWTTVGTRCRWYMVERKKGSRVTNTGNCVAFHPRQDKDVREWRIYSCTGRAHIRARTIIRRTKEIGGGNGSGTLARNSLRNRRAREDSLILLIFRIQRPCSGRHQRWSMPLLHVRFHRRPHNSAFTMYNGSLSLATLLPFPLPPSLPPSPPCIVHKKEWYPAVSHCGREDARTRARPLVSGVKLPRVATGGVNETCSRIIMLSAAGVKENLIPWSRVRDSCSTNTEINRFVLHHVVRHVIIFLSSVLLIRGCNRRRTPCDLRIKPHRFETGPVESTLFFLPRWCIDRCKDTNVWFPATFKSLLDDVGNRRACITY